MSSESVIQIPLNSSAALHPSPRAILTIERSATLVSARLQNPVHQLLGLALEPECESGDVLQRNVDLAAFDLTYEGPVNISKLGEFLLGQSPVRPDPAEVFPKAVENANGGDWHTGSVNVLTLCVHTL